MISFDRYQSILRQSDAAVQQAAGQAFAKLLDKIRQGQAPRSAIDQIMREFNADTLTGFREAFSAVLESSLGEKEMKAWPVGGVKLSDRLYANAQQVSTTTRQIIEAHMKGPHSARELAKTLYEGYNFKEDELKVIAGLPKYLRPEFNRALAAKLKTPALRAAYLEAIRAKEAGAGMDAIEKKLQVAFYERNRYFANRIARTELHRNYTDQQARDLMEQDRIEYVQLRLSSKHPKPDICDLHARADLYGLGAGVYPKAEAPKPPFHPHCLPGDALITASGRITAVSKRWYDGDMAVITTASGQQLAATINHPVLTRRGWVAIGQIQLGDQVICRVGGPGCGIGNNQHQNMPTRISEIADAFFGSRQVATREVPTAAEDFHNDGMAGQIAVIGANSQLWDWFDAISAEAIKDNPLVVTHEPHTLFSDGVFDLGFKRFGLSTDRRMSGLSPLFTEFGSGLEVFESLRLMVTAGLDTHSVEPMINNGSADLHFLSETQNGTTGRVFADDVIRVDIQSLHGDVYNLETEQGHYTSNNIITHNCYCLISPKIDLINPKPRFNPKAERAFLASLPFNESRQVAGSIDKRDRILEDGETMEEVYNEGKDELYQWKRVGDLEGFNERMQRLYRSEQREYQKSEKLFDPVLRDELFRMRDTAGWAEEGGQLLRDADGNVTGRTKWTALADWFADYKAMHGGKGLTSGEMPKVISQILKGKITKKGQDFLDWKALYDQEQKRLQQEMEDLMDPMAEESRLMLQSIKQRFIEKAGSVGESVVTAMLEEYYQMNPLASPSEANNYLINEMKDWFEE